MTRDEAPKTGRSLPLSLTRRLMCDLMACAKRIPSVPVQRTMNVGRLVEARGAVPASHAPGWVAIFAKAYGITAHPFPELRRTYLPFPRARLYEHPFSIASIAVERVYEGETAVLWGHVRAPEQQPLRKIQAHLQRLKDAPVESIGFYRRALSISRLPWPLRRAAWWIGLNVSGAKKAKSFGTFGISVYSSLGAEGLHPISPLTGTLNYGVIQPDGSLAVRLIYDHRVVDGATVARALACMEEVLNGDILAELRETPASQAA
jgi:hypothetical protein